MYGIPETAGMKPTSAEPAAIPPETDDERMTATRMKKQATEPQITATTIVATEGNGNSTNMRYAANEPRRKTPSIINL